MVLVKKLPYLYSGKTTTFHCLTGIVPNSDGEIQINGENVKKDNIRNVFEELEIGMVP